MHGLVPTEGSETKVELERSKSLSGRPIAIESAQHFSTPHGDNTLEVPPPFVFSCMPFEPWNAESKGFQIALERVEGKWTEGT
jgi:hypothetical protein